MVRSCTIADKPVYAVITSCDRFGWGVFSWHVHRGGADENALETGGVVVPVDYVNGDLIVPSLASRVISRHLGG